MTQIANIDAVCFDFYNTLVHHTNGRGRGAMLMDYLETAGLESDPWQHQVIYDVFNPIAEDYPIDNDPEKMRAFQIRLAECVFRCLNIKGNEDSPDDHAMHLWSILGPDSLVTFPETETVLKSIRSAGLRIAVVSNWHCGLIHFCNKLGIGTFLDHVVVSAEVGSNKPDQHIFNEALRLLGTNPERTLHVGDTYNEDITGARDAGLQAIHVKRGNNGNEKDDISIRSLEELLGILGLN